MRSLIAVLLVAAMPQVAAALPLPRTVADGAGIVVPVQNRFLPGFLGGGERKPETDANANARLEQLEAQVRMLTGQVEQLTFSVRRMEQLIQQMQAGDQQGSLAGPGEPPRSLGSVPGAPSDPSRSTASAPSSEGQSAGPIDLSVLNNGVGTFGGTDTTPSTPTAPSTAAPPSDPALANVRQLQSSGRYAMAAQEARTVLEANPTGPVAGEARYMLGEALLAQGDYRGAANQFLENYTSEPNNPRAPQSLLQLGKALNGLGEREAACSSLEELFGAYPDIDGELRAAAERERQAANCA